jgi:hypothetical protein
VPESFRLLTAPPVVFGELRLKIRWDCDRTLPRAGDLFDEKAQWHPYASTTKDCVPVPEEKKGVLELQETLEMFAKNSFFIYPL